MLTKDLLRVRKVSGSIKPQFIDSDNTHLQETARELIETYELHVGSERGVIQETVNPFLQTQKDVKLLKGLNKILLDRCEFSHVASTDYPGERERLFVLAAAVLKSGELGRLQDYRDRIIAQDPALSDFMGQGIYGDLPENEQLIKVRKTFPKELLDRYNVSLVQALLLHSQELKITAQDAQPTKLRNILRYLKFFRLLADFEIAGPLGEDGQFSGKTVLHITVNGPLILFENTQKYGFQLACFFPVICRLDQWKLTSSLKMGKHDYRLKLDESTGLVCHYRNLSDFIPEEFTLFEAQFREKSGCWQVLEEPGVLNFGKQRIFFPDFSFRHIQTGRTVHLELFHRWHSAQLLDRLDFCENEMAEAGKPSLILGIDRFLYNNDHIKEKLEQSPFFHQSCFVFRDFPGYNAVSSCLDRQLKNDREGMEQVGFEF